ncbi:hypothetical protein [Chryseobacterium tongliaoense]|uniref:hypothetical protein n=1 Tax=Chryseobacterium tongliaoense TaxID=3240933 RepID=UPI003518E502
MRKKICLLFTIAFTVASYAQEFTTFNNGLIYSENTMNKLEKIVDSLNLKYKICDLNKKFYSKPQTKCFIIRLDSGNIIQAKKDMDSNISIEDFISKYPDAKIKKEVLVIKTKRKNYRDQDVIRYDEISLNDDNGFGIEQNYKKALYEKTMKNTWVYTYKGKSSYSPETIEAFYFPDNFKSIQLDQKYARQIIYSDCLIDPSITKFKENAPDAYRFEMSLRLPENWQKLSHAEKEELLDDMRSKQVVGGCSQDSSPRIQGINIALLSAETANWGVFLKSHLDIMNDRFERVSDGSYAWEARQTYIKELEELDINVFDLIFGITFRIENAEKNHYYGDVGRLGRAISESKDRDLFFSQIRHMIEDENLDDYNRIISYFLYINCNHYTKNEREKKINTAKLYDSFRKLPPYLSGNIKPEEI